MRLRLFTFEDVPFPLVLIDDPYILASLSSGAVSMGSMGSAEPIDFFREVLEPIKFEIFYTFLVMISRASKNFCVFL